MVDKNLGTDLFGDPVLPRREGRGRPEHVWSREKSNRVHLAFARGLSVKEAAIAIGVSAPTLRKVYFAEVKQREAARLRMEIEQLGRLNAQAEKGNVGAEKELAKQIERQRSADMARSMASAPPTERAAPTRKLGKKEQAEIAAREVRGLYQPPLPPSRTH